MPSPFPGMDPYIEACGRWGDFHTALLGAFRTRLNRSLPERYAAAIQEYVWIHEPVTGRTRRAMEPDAYVTEHPKSGRSVSGGRGAAATAPVSIRLPAQRRKRPKHLQIVDRNLKRVVTAIEVLSPTNKEAGEDRQTYLLKRQEYFSARVSLIEIDLLRAGGRLPLGKPRTGTDDYCILVCRAWEWPRADCWSFSVRELLPRIPVPLAVDAAEPVLDLQEVVNNVYDDGRYETELDYHQPLTPRLNRQDENWMRSILGATEG